MSALIRPADDPAALQDALELLRAGQVVGLPTDTVYGVACDSLNPSAIRALFAAKGRPPKKAIPLLAANEAQIAFVTREMPAPAYDLIRRYMPGALTIVLPAAAHLPSELTAGGDSVAVRIPANDVVRSLASRLGYPLAVTSANRSGEPDSQTAFQVSESLGAHIAMILDGGQTPNLGASTILDLTGASPRLLREGPITKEMLKGWL